MKKKAAWIVCGILAASFAASAVSDHTVMGVANAAENSGSRATLKKTPELEESMEAASDAGTSSDEKSEAADTGRAGKEETDRSADTGSTSKNETAEAANTGSTAEHETSEAASTGSASEERGSANNGRNDASEERSSANNGRNDASEERSSTESGRNRASEGKAESTEDDGDAGDRGSSADSATEDGEDAEASASGETDASDASDGKETADSDSNDANADADAEAVGKVSDHLSLTIPEDWEDQYVTEETATDGVPSVSYYEKTAHDNGDGGLLFRIGLYRNRENYLSLPDYVYLGTLRTEDGDSYAVVAEFPTDVQFSISAREQYQTMAAEAPSVLRSLTAAEGQTYHAGRNRAERKAEEAYAFADILSQFRSSGMLPNGTQIDISTAKTGDDQYAILDVDGDGQDELVLKIGSKAVSDKVTRAAEDDADETEGENEDAVTSSEKDRENTSEEGSGDNGSKETPAEGDSEESAEEEGSSSKSGKAEETGTASSASTEESDETADASVLFGGENKKDSLDESAEDADGDDSTDAVSKGALAAGEEDRTNGGAAGTTTSTEDADTDTSTEDADTAATEADIDTIAASNYYIFKGDSAEDSHASHLSADDLEEALQNTSEQFISTAYDIPWEDITKGKVNSLYNTAYVPVGESAEHLDALRRKAYKDAVQEIIDNNTLPDGSQAVPYDDFTDEDIEENEFATADVDADGYEELLIRLTNTDEDSTRELVYAYDVDTKKLRLEFEGVPDGVTYYDNGTAQSENRYDNNEPSALWPFALASYNEETGVYDLMGDVYAWDQNVMQHKQGRTVDALGESFPTEADKNGNGRVYFLVKPETEEPASSDEGEDETEEPASSDEGEDETEEPASADEDTAENKAEDEDEDQGQDQDASESSAAEESAEDAGEEELTDANTTPVDDAEILDWYNGIVGEGSQPIFIYWNAITEDNVSTTFAR